MREVRMKRYWIDAQHSPKPFRKYSGKAVLASVEGDEPLAYLMDLSVPQTSFYIPRRHLTEWHEYQPDHRFCFCTAEHRAGQLDKLGETT